MRQRLGIAEAIINTPDLLILDEPTNGLDIEGIIEIRNLIKNLSHQGIAILISSHNLTEINNLCNRIIAIKNGKIVTDDTIDNFTAISKKDNYILELNTTNNLTQIISDFKFEILKENKIRINISREKISVLIQKLIENKYKIYSVKEEKNDIGRSLYKKGR